MLRIAVQSKGRLFEETMALLQEADIKISSSKRILLVQSSNFPIEVLFLRDDDIPQSVAGGVADLENAKKMQKSLSGWASANAVCLWPFPRMWIIRGCLGLKVARLLLLIRVS